MGKNFDNGAEWLALIKGLEIAINCGMEEIAVYGDLLMVIREARKLNKNYKSLAMKLHHIFNFLGREIKSLKLFHILRANNKQADVMANKGVL